jgi:hypothetical protein
LKQTRDLGWLEEKISQERSWIPIHHPTRVPGLEFNHGPFRMNELLGNPISIVRIDLILLQWKQQSPWRTRLPPGWP